MLNLLSEIKDCQRCYLRNGCNQVVTGMGSPKARLMLIGEFPNYDDDIIGEPFSGQVGQYLKKILKDVNLNIDEVYITNTVKCKPKKAITLKDDSVSICKNWLWKELQSVSPEIIITLGKLPSQLLLKLKSNFKMNDVAGISHTVTFSTAKIIPWYHPNYLLRQGKAWDIKTIEFFKNIKEQLC